jgi:predicted 2-oxoglutarate/Fe(II)-dependent dioxygenase YbiX
MVDSPHPPAGRAHAEVSDSSTESAPFIYFDGVLTSGVTHGVIRIELAAGAVVPARSGQMHTVHVVTGHLRCSPSAAMELRKAIDGALLLHAPAKGQTS